MRLTHFLATVLTILIITTISATAFTPEDAENVFSKIVGIHLEADNDKCLAVIDFEEENCTGGGTEPPDGYCAARSPGYWKTHLCADNPQSFEESYVTELLTMVDETSEYFSLLTRQQACTILSTNNPLRQRAEKKYLTNLLNYASGKIDLYDTVDSIYSSSTNLNEVFAESDYVLINNIAADYERIGNLHEDIYEWGALDCSTTGGGNGGSCETPCKGFLEGAEILNEIVNVTFKSGIPPLNFEIDAQDPAKTIVEIGPDNFTLNNFTINVTGPFNTKILYHNVSPGRDSERYIAMVNNNTINHTCEYEPEEPPQPPPQECNPCDGKVTQLTLKYLGTTTVEVTAYQKRVDEPIFSGIISQNEEFTVNGVDKFGTLGTELYIYTNGEKNTQIHTSCSQPIGPGMIFGDFEIISGYSKNGGLLCPYEEPNYITGNAPKKINIDILDIFGSEPDVEPTQPEIETCTATVEGFTYEILEIEDNCDGTYTYRIKVTNDNKFGLSNIAFGLPSGAMITEPIGTYNGIANDYNIEITNNPFYSIKFETIGEGIKNGEYEIFEFTTTKGPPDYTMEIQAKAGQIIGYAELECDNIISECQGEPCICTTTIQTNMDCYWLGDRIMFHIWKIINHGEPTTPIKKAIWIVFDFLVDQIFQTNEFYDEFTIGTLNQTLNQGYVEIEAGAQIEQEFMDGIKETIPWGLPTGYYTGNITVEDTTKPFNINITNQAEKTCKEGPYERYGICKYPE